MDALYLAGDTQLRRHENTLQVINREGRTLRLPVQSLKHLIATHDVRLNGALLNLFKQHDVRITVLDYYGHVACTIDPAGLPTSGAVHLKQAEAILNPDRRLFYGRKIAVATLKLLEGNLRYHAYRGKTALKNAIEDIAAFRQRMEQAESVETLMGYEGQARQSYYLAWEHISPNLMLRKRSRRPPADRINCILSFLNGLVYALCLNEIRKSQLDATLSFMHSPQQARYSLSLDLAELFKPVLADRILFSLFNKSILQDSHFDEQPGICLLSEQGRRRVIEAFTEKVDKPVLEDSRSYRQRILEEVFAIQSSLLGLSEYKPFFIKV